MCEVTAAGRSMARLLVWGICPKTARAAPARRSDRGQRQRELASHTRLGAHRDVAAVAVRDLLAQEEPETCARDVHVLFRRQAAEAREQARHVLTCDAKALIPHADDGPRVAEARAAADLAPVRRI